MRTVDARIALVAGALVWGASPARAQQSTEPTQSLEPSTVEPPVAGQVQPSSTMPARAPELVPTSFRRSTTVEAEFGFLALPNAPISDGHRGGSFPLTTIGHGDATPNIGLHFLYRGGPRWAAAASGRFTPFPTVDDEYGAGSGLKRTHERAYFTATLEGRFYLVTKGPLQLYVGGEGGAVVIVDRFRTLGGEQVPAVYGQHAVNLRTEGITLSVLGGINYELSERWLIGTTLRTGAWLLPSKPVCGTLGDCATLRTDAGVVELGLIVGFRSPLGALF